MQFSCFSYIHNVGQPWPEHTYSLPQKETPYPWSNHSSSFSPPGAQEIANLHSFSMDVLILDISYKRNYTIFDLLCMAPFNVFKVHPRCNMYHYLIPSYGWNIFYYMDMAVYGHLNSFVFFAIVNSAELFLYTFLFEHLFSILLELLGHMVRLCLTFYKVNICTILHSISRYECSNLYYKNNECT